MSSNTSLTTEELSQRYNGHPTVRTLEGWRLREFGPKYFSIGKLVKYRLEDIVAWEQTREGKALKERLTNEKTV